MKKRMLLAFVISLVMVVFGFQIAFSGTNTILKYPHYVASDGTPYVFRFQYTGGTSNTKYSMNIYNTSGYSCRRLWQYAAVSPSWQCADDYSQEFLKEIYH